MHACIHTLHIGIHGWDYCRTCNQPKLSNAYMITFKKRTYTHTYIHTYTYVGTCMHAYMRTCKGKYVQAMHRGIHACMHTYGDTTAIHCQTSAYIHVYIHTYIHNHTYIQMTWWRNLAEFWVCCSGMFPFWWMGDSCLARGDGYPVAPTSCWLLQSRTRTHTHTDIHTHTYTHTSRQTDRPTDRQTNIHTRTYKHTSVWHACMYRNTSQCVSTNASYLSIYI